MSVDGMYSQSAASAARDRDREVQVQPMAEIDQRFNTLSSQLMGLEDAIASLDDRTLGIRTPQPPTNCENGATNPSPMRSRCADQLANLESRVSAAHDRVLRILQTLEI